MSTLILDISKIHIVSAPRIAGLPKGFRVDYFGLTPDHRSFVVIRPKTASYRHFVCLVNSYSGQNDFINVNAKNINLYRDGGTIDFDTDIGKFVFPPPSQPKTKPKLDGKEIILYEY